MTREFPGRRRTRGSTLVGAALLGTTAVTAPADAQPSPANDLTALSLEELMAIEVTSASKKSEALRDVAAAVTVITAEDITMSPARTVPDLLRTVPGLQVARLDSQYWGVSARGFNDLLANKLLVLVDGRSIYSSLFSGTIWPLHQIPLQTIARIEVIRGPGATLWGANAVNGVINIITKSAEEMRGTSASLGFGTEERAHTHLSHGAAVGADLSFGGYLTYFDRDGPVDGTGRDLAGDWWEGRAGLRLDWTPTPRDRIELRGDLGQGQSENKLERLSLSPPYRYVEDTGLHHSTANLSADWNRALGPDSEISVSGYWNYWYFERVDRHQAFNLDLQHRFQAGSWNELTWGLGYRLVETDPGADSDVFAFSVGSRIDHLVSGFAQDRISLLPDALDLTIGSKFEYNSLTGFEYQPSARLRWTANDAVMLWGAVSRAVRTPSVGEQTVTLYNTVLAPGEGANATPLPLQDISIASPDQESERLLTYELGGRWRVADWLNLEPALFYSVYDNLLSQDFEGTTVGTTSVTSTRRGGNNISGESFGFELAATAQPTETWRIRATYSYLNLDLRPDEDGTDSVSAPLTEGASPRHQATLTNGYDLAAGLRASVVLRYVDDLPSQDTDAYLGLDAKIVWRPLDAVELSLSGRDLLQARHREFGDNSFNLTGGSDVERSVFGQVKVRF